MHSQRPELKIGGGDGWRFWGRGREWWTLPMPTYFQSGVPPSPRPEVCPPITLATNPRIRNTYFQRHIFRERQAQSNQVQPSPTKHFFSGYCDGDHQQSHPIPPNPTLQIPPGGGRE